MEEKIIIKGTLKETVEKIMIAIIVLFSLSVLISCILLIGKFECVLYYSYYPFYTYYHSNGFEAAFSGNAGCLFFFIVASTSFLIALILLIIFLTVRKSSIIITENNVKGTAIFGKEVVLPLYMVSAYSTRDLFSTIAVATSSGITKFSMIKNYKEIGNELSRLINERQDKTKINQQENLTSNSSFDEIEKLETLLDKNIITQEEFDAKKKQLLGL